VKDNRTH